MGVGRSLEITLARMRLGCLQRVKNAGVAGAAEEAGRRAEEGPEDLVAGSSGGRRGRWTAAGSAGGEEDK